MSEATNTQFLPETKNDRMLKFISEHPTSNVARSIKLIEQTKIKSTQLSKPISIETDMIVRRRNNRIVIEQRPSKSVVSTAERVLRLKRWSDIIEMRLNQGLTLEEIGIKLKPKISRERVRQILKQITSEFGIEFPCNGSFVETACKKCAAMTRIRTCHFRGHGHHNCPKHTGFYKYSTDEERSEAIRAKSILKYNTNPDFKARRKRANAKWYATVKDDPVYRAKQLKYSRKYHVDKKR